MLIETLAVERHQLSASRFSGEPELYELLHDPIARALMAADKVDCGDVYTLLRKTRGNVASRDSVR